MIVVIYIYSVLLCMYVPLLYICYNYFYFTTIVSVLYIDTSVKTFLSMYGGCRFCHVKRELQVFFTGTFRCSSRVPLCAPWKISRSDCARSHSFFCVTYIQRGLTSFVAFVSVIHIRYFIIIILFLDVCDLFDIYFSAVLYSKDIAEWSDIVEIRYLFE